MTATSRLLASLSACVSMALSTGALAGPVDSFDDIVNWIGTGSNRAAVVIDFDGMSDADASLVWGFRWDGAARGRDMLNAVIAADARLYAKIGNTGSVFNAILGLGYDRNDDGAFAVDSGEAFNDDGVAFGEPIENEDYHVQSVDPADRYREGWEYAGFWHYGIADANPWTGGAWEASQFGTSFRTLVDGAWDSWAFSTDADNPDVFGSIFAQDPVAATPPGGHADFDDDGDFDGADLLAWQRGFGTTLAATPSEGDANGDGDVDAGDLASWIAAFGAGPAGRAVPEPSVLRLWFGVLALVRALTHLRRRND